MSGKPPLRHLLPQVETLAWPGHQFTDLERAEIQAYLRPGSDSPPLATPIALPPQLEIAMFSNHNLQPASTRAAVCINR